MASRKEAVTGSTSFLGLLLIIILPNCPVCIMAYSTAISMCGGPDMYLSSNNWVSYLPLFFSLLIMALILMKNKGLKTYVAVGLAFVGFLFILGSHQLIIPSDFYYVGTCVLFIAIWLNGSLFSAINLIKTSFLAKSQIENLTKKPDPKHRVYQK